jgi:hypothetical protein
MERIASTRWPMSMIWSRSSTDGGSLPVMIRSPALEIVQPFAVRSRNP